MKEEIERLRREVYFALKGDTQTMVIPIYILAAILNVHGARHCRHGVLFEEWCKDCQKAGAGG